MFFKQVRRNAAKNRKGNGLFFGSLVTAIIAFYTLLSLGELDVMHFLSTIENDAVQKLMALLPLVYVVSLFFVFFLVYFACRYQIDSRRRELGMYLMLGMKRGRLFLLLFCETLWSSVVSLMIGLSASLFVTEGISLATARIVGLGILGHRFSFSPGAICWTVCGFVLVQLLSMFILCIGIAKKEPAEFFQAGDVKKQVVASGFRSTLCFAAGLGFLLYAYGLGMFRLHSLRITVVLSVFVFGISGTFLLYRGLGGMFGLWIRAKSKHAAGLQIFTARQVQENVLSQHRSLAISSLLLLMALACISYGISMGFGRSSNERSVDISLFGTEEQVDAVLEQDGVREMVQDSFPMYLSMIKHRDLREGDKKVDISRLADALATLKKSGMRTFEQSDLIENIIENFHIEYVIAQSSYNHLLRSMGKEELQISDGQAAVYTSMGNDGDFGLIWQEVLEGNVSISIDGEAYELLPDLCMDNVVADRAITLYLALIVPDDLYRELAVEPEAYCWNVRLSDRVVEDVGLMRAIQDMEGLLDQTEGLTTKDPTENLAVNSTGIEYDSYLGGIGRNLFYTVAASYLTIYLGVLFWLIANTVIGVKYLIGQRETKHRYETLSMLGAHTSSMCVLVNRQIRLYFSLVLVTAIVSSAAAIYSMFTSFTKLPVGVSVGKVALLAVLVLVIFAGLEILYIRIVRRMADREIRMLQTTKE
jgi:putative ABC transport system permease protein